LRAAAARRRGRVSQLPRAPAGRARRMAAQARRGRGRALRSLLTALLVAVPAPTGPYAVGTKTITVREGLRVVPVQLWYPTAATGRSAYMPKAVADAVGGELRVSAATLERLTVKAAPDASV